MRRGIWGSWTGEGFGLLLVAVTFACGDQTLLGTIREDADAEVGDVLDGGEDSGVSESDGDAGESTAWEISGAAWARAYESEVYSGGPTVAAASGDGFLACAGDHVLRLDARGGVLWERAYQAEWVPEVLAAAEPGWMLAGGIRGIWTVGGDVTLIRLDVDGQVTWQKSYSCDLCGGEEAVTSAVSAAGGGYYLAGHADRGDGIRDAWIVALDAAGAIRWSRIVGGDGWENVGDATEVEGGGVIVVGQTDSFRPPFGWGVYEPMTLRLGADGTLVGVRRYTGWTKAGFYSVDGTGDGGFVVGGAVPDAEGVGQDALVAKLDSDGNVVWAMTFGGAGDDAVVAVDRAATGGYLAVARTESFGAGGNEFWALRLDEDGQSVWQKTYGGPGEDEPSAGLVLPDGAILLAGSTSTYSTAGSTAVWVLKSDADGWVSPDCPAGMIGTSAVVPVPIPLVAEEVVLASVEAPTTITELTRPWTGERTSVVATQCGR